MSRERANTDPAIATRIAAMRRSLDGLALGDSVGQALRVALPSTELSFDDPPWQYSDDTEMAMAIAEILMEQRRIDQDKLADAFATRFVARPHRGYGSVAYWILSRISEGAHWRTVVAEPFRGNGSFGNGGAMRAGPLGAFFADDLSRVVEEATLSAAVTHAHPEGQAGAVAVALAAAIATTPSGSNRAALLVQVADRISEGEVREGLVRAAHIGNTSPRHAGDALGTGVRVSAQDTVPYALWCAFGNLHDYRAALLTAISGFESSASDRDTICAIVGSIVALSCEAASVPVEWLAHREALPQAWRI